MSASTNVGSPGWLRTMACCNCRCGDSDDAAGLEAAADRLDQLVRANAALRAENETLRAAINAARKEGGAS